MFISVLLGLTFLCSGYILCLIFVCGIKFVLNAARKKFAPKPEIKPVKPRKRQPASIRSIEINPEEIDRIYFGKAK